MSNLDRQFLRDMAFTAPFNKPDGSPQGDNRLVYTSNIQRADAVAMLKEFLLMAGAAEDWMKHIK